MTCHATDDLNVEDSHLAFCEGELSGHWSLDEASPADREEIREVARAILAHLRWLPVEAREDALGA